MRKVRALFWRFGGLFNKQRNDRELEEEIETHVQMHIEDNLQLGMTPEEARRQAMIKLGGIESTKEAYRNQRGLPVLQSLLQDIRYGARTLRKNPGFTAVAVLTLAICIGANLAIFAVMDAILVRSLPLSHADRLVVIHNAYPASGVERGQATISDYFERRGSIDALGSPSMFQEGTCIVGERDAARWIKGAAITPEFFQTLGIALVKGATFTDAEMNYGGHDQVAIHQSTNVLGWNFPLEFYCVQYLPTGTNLWNLHLTAKGKLTSIKEGIEPQIPPEVQKDLKK